MTASRLDDRELDLRKRSLARIKDLLERVESRPPRQTPPRVETLRSQLRAAQSMLQLVGEHLDTLHDLAYDRARAAERLRVKGGSTDYALDTNGDPRARELYQQAAWEVIDLLDDSTVVAHDIVRFMKDGLQSNRRRSAVEAKSEDIVAALDAQRRRIDRGESTGPTETQPKVKTPSHAEVDAELRALRTAAAKLRPTRLTKSERQRLTPLEAQAWERAVPRPTTLPRGVMQRARQRGAPLP